MKKIYIGEEITTPSWEDWVEFAKPFLKYKNLNNQGNFLVCGEEIIPAMCGRVGVFKHNEYNGAISIILNGDCISYEYPREPLETLLNCEFINEKRPESHACDALEYQRDWNKEKYDYSTSDGTEIKEPNLTYKEFNNQIHVFKEEPMKKLKTRDEIIKILMVKTSLDATESSIATECLTDEGIIEVAEEEVPSWGDIYATLQEIVENDDNDTSIRMKLAVVLKNIKKLNKD